MEKFVNLKITDDCGGIACGPCGCSVFVEIEIEKNNNPVFVAISRMSEYENAQVFDHSVINTLATFDNDFNYDEFVEEAIENHSYEIGDISDLEGSDYFATINLARTIMKEAYYNENYDELEDKFKGMFVGSDIESLNLPVANECDDEDEEDEED